MMGRVKGICYGNDAFPAPYTESNANSFQCTFGSDATADHIGALHGGLYQNEISFWCAEYQERPLCRDDVNAIYNMGVEVIRLYDWDPRNSHESFLDHCHKLGLGVLVSVSDYNLRSDQGFRNMKQNIPALIRSYSQGGDYHPAVQGVVFANEFNRNSQISVANVVAFTNAWASIEQQQFPSHRKIMIGHPVAFGLTNNENDCWYVWKQLLPQISALNSRLFLAPQTYNPASDLFNNYRNNGKGYVDLTYDEFKLPIWFTEIGLDRTKGKHVEVVTGQLESCINYSKQNPSKLIGCCMFSYLDKVWVKGKSEGSFGAWTHARPGPVTVSYGDEDFPHSRDKSLPLGTLNIDILEKTDLYGAVTKAYKM